MIESFSTTSFLLKNFPFLIFYEDMSKIISKFAENTLIRIAKELESQIFTVDIRSLKHLVTERYYRDLEEHFYDSHLFVRPIIDGLGTCELNTFLNYQLVILPHLMEHQERELSKSKEMLRNCEIRLKETASHSDLE